MNILREITNILDPNAFRNAQGRGFFGGGGISDNMSYEELLALGNRIGNVKKGLTKQQINVIIFKFTYIINTRKYQL